MGQTLVMEGTTEEITRQMQQNYPGQNLRVIIEPEETEDLTAGMPDPPFTVRDKAHLVELLLEGVNSGPAVPVTDQDWEEIRQEVHDRAARRKGTVSGNA